jgi:D-amino-acid dehydrogenase
MRIAIIGAGITGVCTAFELADDGHDVTVFDRRGSVAAEASFATAGLLGHASLLPWAERRVGLPGWLGALAGQGPLHWHRRADRGSLRWLWQWSRSAGLPVNADRWQQLQQLARFSQERLHDLRTRLKLDIERAQGALVVFQTERARDAAQADLARLAQWAVPHTWLDADACRARETGLSADAPLAGGVWLPGDEVSNCRQVAHALRHHAQRAGVTFRFHSAVSALRAGGTGQRPQVVHVYAPPEDSTVLSPSAASPGSHGAHDAPRTEAQPFSPTEEAFDAVVVCAAQGAASLLGPLGLALPLAAVSVTPLTAPMRLDEAHPGRGPSSALLDAQARVLVTRMGHRLRVSGGALLGAGNATQQGQALETLEQALRTWYPGVARLSQALRWQGVRTATPDGMPLIGASGAPGVWLNLGHGDTGWALACGSARLLADRLRLRGASRSAHDLSLATGSDTNANTAIASGLNG